MTTTTILLLNGVKKKTPFYPYKIDFVLSQLKLNDKEKEKTIQQLEQHLNKANNKTVTAQNLWTWINSSLPEKARRQQLRTRVRSL